MKPDTGTRTERDAERYEARRAWLDAVRCDDLLDQVDAWDFVEEWATDE
jgi:hypothetical protein